MSELNNLTVVAIGGHSLLDPSRLPTVNNQFSVTAAALEPVVRLIERGERVVLTHGNGPQVGFMQRRCELASEELHTVPLDSLVADTQGSLGYMIQRALREALRQRGINSQVATVVTEVEVDPEDQAFEDPTKPIGRFYTKEQAEQYAAERDWNMVDDAGRGWRRVVASPNPTRIVQFEIINQLIESGVHVICCGGGGIPIFRNESGQIEGVECVIDKDRVSARLAVQLQAKRFVITTGVDAVYRDFLTDNPVKIPQLTVEEVRALAHAGQFPPGSMRPKMEAAIFYLNRTPGAEFIVCRPDDLVEAIDGECGTRIRTEAS
ncbi:MAG TPA: carbamate kinase [Myxococcales bacterium]|nr:carbamate kinase [Myxococcales bacterium]HIN86736.1 carbamate kinase [Myxococcales bacterium]